MTRWLWLGSAVVSLVAGVLLVAAWESAGDYEPFPGQLPNAEEARAFLAEDAGRSYPDDCSDAGAEAAGAGGPVLVPTGVFVQSMQFETASDVHVTGYIWQRLSERLQAERAAGTFHEGFIFPEQIDGTGADFTETYRVEEAGRCGPEEVIGWYFEATLRQQFTYADYPFDDKAVWVRVWPTDFGRDVVLFPDYGSYVSTRLEDEFGIEEDIVLGEWEIKETYFDYRLFHDDGTPYAYDTNFGIDDYVGRVGFPELRFNVVLIREFENAFLVNLIPLLVVAVFAFATLLTVTIDEQRSGVLGFSTAGTIGALSALFFVVLLAHVQLREQFAARGVVYLEWYFFVIYVVLLAVAVNTYLVSVSAQHRLGWLRWEDNLVPKVLYWPALLIALVVVSWVVL